MNQSGLALIAYPSRVIAGSRRRTRRGRRRPSLRRGRGLVSFLSCHAFPRSRSLVYRRRRQRKHASIRDAAKSSCLLESLPRCRESLACLHEVSHHPQPAHSRSPCQPGSPASRERITLGNHVARAAARHTARAERGRRCSSSSSGEGDVELLRLPCCFPLPRPSFRSSSSRTLWQWHRRPWSWCDDIAVPSQASQDCKWRADRFVDLMADPHRFAVPRSLCTRLELNSRSTSAQHLVLTTASTGPASSYHLRRPKSRDAPREHIPRGGTRDSLTRRRRQKS